MYVLFNTTPEKPKVVIIGNVNTKQTLKFLGIQKYACV